MWGSRVLLFPLFGLGPYDYGKMPTRYFMEFPIQMLGYAIVVSLTMLYDRQTRATQLEKSLAQAQLHNLRLQLQPHFLFNTLNTISAVMYENVHVADRMIARLSDLLRMSLEQGGAQEVPLEREIEFLKLYVETMKARFEERLNVAIEASEDTQRRDGAAAAATAAGGEFDSSRRRSELIDGGHVRERAAGERLCCAWKCAITGPAWP